MKQLVYVQNYSHISFSLEQRRQWGTLNNEHDSKRTDIRTITPHIKEVMLTFCSTPSDTALKSTRVL